MFTFENIRCFLALTVLAQNFLANFNMASSITLKSSKIVYINQLLTTCKALFVRMLVIVLLLVLMLVLVLVLK